MGFFKRFRRQRALKKSASLPHNDLYEPAPYAYYGPDQTYRLPDTVLRRIFEHVCPHSADETLNDSEHSGNDGCMSCDMRDLAHCALTRRQWYGIAAGLLYVCPNLRGEHDVTDHVAVTIASASMPSTTAPSKSGIPSNGSANRATATRSMPRRYASSSSRRVCAITSTWASAFA